MLHKDTNNNNKNHISYRAGGHFDVSGAECDLSPDPSDEWTTRRRSVDGGIAGPGRTELLENFNSFYSRDSFYTVHQLVHGHKDQPECHYTSVPMIDHRRPCVELLAGASLGICNALFMPHSGCTQTKRSCNAQLLLLAAAAAPTHSSGSSGPPSTPSAWTANSPASVECHQIAASQLELRRNVVTGKFVCWKSMENI